VLVLLDHRDPVEAEQIRCVLHAAYSEEAALIGAREFPPLHRTAADIAASPGGFHGYYLGDVLAGVIEYGSRARPGCPVVEISSLAVDPRHARQGIGSRLVGFVIETNPGRDVTVSTARSNTPAIILYQRLGFAVEREFTAPGGIECVALLRPG